MREKSIQEWVCDLLAMNFGLMAILMLFAPVYAWWFFVVLAIVMKVVRNYYSSKR